MAVDKSDNTLTIEFGTTLETDPLYSSYGISALRLYIRWLNIKKIKYE